MQFEAELVLNLFLFLGNFEARCSYKIVLIQTCILSGENETRVQELECWYYFRLPKHENNHKTTKTI